MSNYINYHKHSHYTAGIGMVDCNVKPIDYAERIIELKGNTFFTTEHGYGGDIFNYKTITNVLRVLIRVYEGKNFILDKSIYDPIISNLSSL